MAAHPVINWLDKEELRVPIKNQGTRCNCWSLVVADVVGMRNVIGKRRKSRCQLSSQYLMDDYIRHRPENVPRGARGFFTMDSYRNYPLDSGHALDFVKDHGIPYESDYPYTGTRDCSDKDPKELRKLQKLRKVRISSYSKLGCTSQGSAAKEKVYKGLGRGPLVATIDVSVAFIRYKGDGVLRPQDVEESSGELFVPGSDDSSDDESSDKDSSNDDGHDPSDDVDDIEYISHALTIVGMDFDDNFFYVVNSMGEDWGLNGVGKIDCDLIYDILEPHIKEPPSTNSPKSKSQKREMKRLGKAISEKCVIATGAVVTGRGVSERVAGIKTRVHATRCLRTFRESVGPGFIFERMYRIMKEHKNPKILSEGLPWMVTAVEDYGVSLLKVKDLIDFCKEVGLQSSAATTRNATIKLVGALHKLIGPDIKGFLSDVKPALLCTFDTEYEKNPFEGVSVALKKTVKVADSASSASQQCGVVVSIRMKSIEAVNKILEEANERVQPAGTDGGIASRMGPAVEKASKGILFDVLQRLRDNKMHMRECTLNTLDLWLADVHLDKMVPHVADAFKDAKIGTKGCRDLIEWLSRQVAGFKDFTDAIHLLKPVAIAMTALPSSSRDTTEVLDVFLRWFVLRLCDSTTSCILKVFELLPELFGMPRNGGCVMTELEAAILLPCLFKKSGHNIEKLQEKMLEALRSRNNRMWIESVDLVTFLLDNHRSEGPKQHWMVAEEDLEEETEIA